MRFSCSFLALTLWALWLACDLFLISTAERLGWFASGDLVRRDRIGERGRILISYRGGKVEGRNIWH